MTRQRGLACSVRWEVSTERGEAGGEGGSLGAESEAATLLGFAGLRRVQTHQKLRALWGKRLAMAAAPGPIISPSWSHGLP